MYKREAKNSCWGRIGSKMMTGQQLDVPDNSKLIIRWRATKKWRTKSWLCDFIHFKPKYWIYCFISINCKIRIVYLNFPSNVTFDDYLLLLMNLVNLSVARLVTNIVWWSKCVCCDACSPPPSPRCTSSANPPPEPFYYCFIIDHSWPDFYSRFTVAA